MRARGICFCRAESGIMKEIAQGVFYLFLCNTLTERGMASSIIGYGPECVMFREDC